mmetsp:Transcript_16910/g.46684  ORF Transcript_16910/g.46684 Transcript_16910/m.46684 type:complete len:203 (+) Transcript_16910:1776-2384(+)
MQVWKAVVVAHPGLLQPAVPVPTLQYLQRAAQAPSEVLEPGLPHLPPSEGICAQDPPEAAAGARGSAAAATAAAAAAFHAGRHGARHEPANHAAAPHLNERPHTHGTHAPPAFQLWTPNPPAPTAATAVAAAQAQPCQHDGRAGCLSAWNDQAGRRWHVHALAAAQQLAIRAITPHATAAAAALLLMGGAGEAHQDGLGSHY